MQYIITKLNTIKLGLHEILERDYTDTTRKEVTMKSIQTINEIINDLRIYETESTN